MMNLLPNMDLRGTKDNILAKANNAIEFYCPPSKDGGISDGGNSLNRNAALAHSKDGGISDGGNSLNRNAALAHSIKFCPFHSNK